MLDRVGVCGCIYLSISIYLPVALCIYMLIYTYTLYIHMYACVKHLLVSSQGSSKAGLRGRGHTQCDYSLAKHTQSPTDICP